MTDELPELEPLEAAAPAAALAANAPTPPMAPPVPPGLPAPAYNPAADKEYYRFLFGGVVITIGCLMPFGPEWDMAGYKTLSGALCLVVGIGLIWSWWGAISTNRFRGANLKWVAFALVPLILMVFGMMRAFEAPAVKAFFTAGKPMPQSWSEFLSAFFSLKDGLAQEKADNFVRALGGGKIVILLGALWTEFAFLLGIFGGAKTARAQKAAKLATAAANKQARRR